MENLIGYVAAIAIVMMSIGGYYQYQMNESIGDARTELSTQQARHLVAVKKAADRFIDDNAKNNISGEVPCMNLVSWGYITDENACVDPLGQELSLWVSSPYGVPQSWVVGASSGTEPTDQILKKVGIDNEIEFQAFATRVARKIASSSKGESSGYVVDVDSTAFTEADRGDGVIIMPSESPETYDGSNAGKSGLWADLKEYFPEEDVPSRQTLPEIFAPMKGENRFNAFAGTMLAEAGYWLWRVDQRNVWVGRCSDNGCFSKTIIQDVGYSFKCPGDGLRPTDWPGKGVRTYKGYPHIEVGQSQSAKGRSSHAFEENSSMATTLCIPFPKSSYDNITGGGTYVGTCSNKNNSAKSNFCQKFNGTSGAQTGWMGSCQGLGCHKEGLIGAGYNAANASYLTGHASRHWWKYNDPGYRSRTAGKNLAMYGTVNFLVPGGFNYTLFVYTGGQGRPWNNGTFMRPGGHLLFVNGDQRGRKVVTANAGWGRVPKAWNLGVTSGGANGNSAVINLR